MLKWWLVVDVVGLWVEVLSLYRKYFVMYKTLYIHVHVLCVYTCTCTMDPNVLRGEECYLKW